MDQAPNSAMTDGQLPKNPNISVFRTFSNEELSLDEHYKVRSHLPQLFSYSRFQKHLESNNDNRHIGIKTSKCCLEEPRKTNGTSLGFGHLSDDVRKESLEDLLKVRCPRAPTDTVTGIEAYGAEGNILGSSIELTSKIEVPLASRQISKWASALNFSEVNDSVPVALGNSFKPLAKVPSTRYGERYCAFSSLNLRHSGLPKEDGRTPSGRTEWKAEASMTNRYLVPASSMRYPNFLNLSDELDYGESFPLQLTAAGGEDFSKRATLDLGRISEFPSDDSTVRKPQNPVGCFDRQFSEVQCRPLSCFASDSKHKPPRSIVFGTTEIMQGLKMTDFDMPHFVFPGTASEVPKPSSPLMEGANEKQRNEADKRNEKLSSDAHPSGAHLKPSSNSDSFSVSGLANRGCPNPILNDAVYARVEMETKLMRLNTLKEMRYRDMMRSYQSLSTRAHEFHVLCLNGLTENIAARAMALVASERYSCVNEEIRRLYTLLRGPIDTASKKCLGTLDLWNIVIPLNPLTGLAKTTKDCRKYAFMCIMKHQETVVWTEVIYFGEKLLNKRLEFQAKLSLANLCDDHRVQFSLYAMSLKEAYSSSRSSVRERITKMLTQKPSQKHNAFPWNTDLQLAAVCQISLSCANKRQFTFDMVNLPTLIHGSFFACIRYSCSDLNNFQTSGYLSFLQRDDDTDSWQSYWCALKDGDILLWPSQEDANQEPKKVFQLKYCTSKCVEVASWASRSGCNAMLLEFNSNDSSTSRFMLKTR